MRYTQGPVAILPALLLASAITHAQPPTFTVTPDSALPGVTRMITGTASPFAGFERSYTNCVFSGVYTGGPGGSPVPLFSVLCSPPSTPIPIPPCGTITGTWTPPNSLGPGTYWLRCFYNQGGTSFLISWADFRIDGPAEPTLTAPAPQVGQPWNITLSHPSDPAAGYFAAASLTTDTGVPGPGFFLSLDIDFLFNLSFPVASPLLFSNLVGGLDASGNATLTVHIPPVSAITCLGLHVQAYVFSPTQAPVLTNCLDDTIQ